jgi:GT2 family glycosyltransferase
MDRSMTLSTDKVRSTFPMRVSVIIVTYNGRSLLGNCLAALEAQTRFPDESIVVDNGSTDDTIAYVSERFPWVTLIGSRENLGFAGGNNLGIRASSGEVVVLLNNDTIPCPGLIADLIAPLERDARIGSVAGTMLFSSEPQLVASAGIAVHQNGLALDHAIGARWDERPEEQEVFGPCAGAAAYRRSALDAAGLFPDDYFMYHEDVDLAWRLRLAGWSSIAVRSAHVHHVYSASEGKNTSSKDFYLARNRVRYLVRCWPGVAWRYHWWRVALYEAGALVYGLATRNWRSLWGRVRGWMGLPRLIQQRRSIQFMNVADESGLVYWLQPSPGSRELLRIRREIRRLAANRPPT